MQLTVITISMHHHHKHSASALSHYDHRMVAVVVIITRSNFSNINYRHHHHRRRRRHRHHDSSSSLPAPLASHMPFIYTRAALCCSWCTRKDFFLILRDPIFRNHVVHFCDLTPTPTFSNWNSTGMTDKSSGRKIKYIEVFRTMTITLT